MRGSLEFCAHEGVHYSRRPAACTDLRAAILCRTTQMTTQPENWNDIKYFLAVARRKSLTAAAKHLSVNHSTVFRRITQLEAELNTRLFERHATGYTLTKAGEQMLTIATRIEDDILTLGRRIAGHDSELNGSVRITTLEEIAALLAPDLYRFHSEHPGIELQVISDQRVFSLSRHEADVAIRPGSRPQEADVVGKELMKTVAGLYASREYLTAHGVPTDSTSLQEHSFVHFAVPPGIVRQQGWIYEHVEDPRIAYVANTMLGQLTAVRAGLGIGMVPSFMADPTGLVRLQYPAFQSQAGVWILYHADLRQTYRVRTFIDFITAALQRHRALFAGETSTWSP